MDGKLSTNEHSKTRGGLTQAISDTPKGSGNMSSQSNQYTPPSADVPAKVVR